MTHNKVCNGSASPHLVCGWLRHLIRKPDVASHNLNNGVMWPSAGGMFMRPKQVATVFVSLIIGAVIGAIAGFLALAIVLAVISLFESDQTALGWTWILTFPAVLLGGIVGAGWSLKYVSNLSDKST